jgi:hypothetical protein
MWSFQVPNALTTKERCLQTEMLLSSILDVTNLERVYYGFLSNLPLVSFSLNIDENNITVLCISMRLVSNKKEIIDKSF